MSHESESDPWRYGALSLGGSDVAEVGKDASGG
jgi:hypothetical protein